MVITKLRRLNLIITYFMLIAYNVVLELIVQNNTSTFCVLQECVSFRTTQAPPPLLYMNVRCCACKIWAKWHIVIFLLLVFMYDVMKMYVWNVALIAKLYSCVHAALTAKLWKFLNNIYVQNCIPVYCTWKGYSQLMMTTGTHLTSWPFF